MAVYTSIPSLDIKKLASAYGLEVELVTPMKVGNSNSNFKLETNEASYMLSVLEEKSVAEAQNLIYLHQWLHKYGFKTSVALEKPDGQTLSLYDGKPLWVKKWINGEIHQDLTTDQLKEAGYQLAILHQVPVPSFLPTKHSYEASRYPALFNRQIDEEYEKWLRKQYDFIQNQQLEGLPMGLIHGDLFYDNIVFEKGKLQAIIDFEEACYHFLVFDIGMALIGLCQNNDTIDEVKAEAFIEGYSRIRKMNDREQDLLPFFTAYAATGTSAWRFWKYNIDVPNPERKSHHWQMVRLAKSIKY